MSIAAAVLVSTDCSLPDFCTRGTPGCVDPGCHDGEKGGDETGVDCGGSCAPCATGEACVAAADCASGHCVGDRCCEAPCALWAASYGGLGSDIASRVAVAPDGSIYVAGAFSGIVDFGGGPLASAGGTDFFVLALDAGGKHRWSQRFGGALDEGSLALRTTAAGHVLIAVTSQNQTFDFGGGPLGGTTDGNPYLAELDASGKHVWSRAYAGKLDIVDLALAPDGDILLSAAYWQVDFGAAGKLASKGSNDVLLARLGPTGDPRWAKGYGNVWGDIPAAVTTSADGSIHLLLRYSRSSSYGGKPLPDSGGAFSIGVVKLDGSGGHLWSRGFVNGRSHTASGIAADDRGGVFISAAVDGSLDVGTGPLPEAQSSSALVAKLAASTGETLWAKSSGEHTASAHAVVPDGHGGAIVSGVFKGKIDFGDGVGLPAGIGQPFVVRFDAEGHPLWARAAEGSGEWVTLAAAPGGDRLVIAGGYRGTLDIGTGALPSRGGVDAFVAEVSP